MSILKELFLCFVAIILLCCCVSVGKCENKDKSKKDILALIEKVKKVGDRALNSERDKIKAIKIMKEIANGALSSEYEKIEAVEILGKIKHEQSVEVLEDILLFKWERNSSSTHQIKHSRRIKK